MKAMFVLINEVGDHFVNYLFDNVKGGIKIHEMKDTFSRVATDVIATCAFGVTSDSLRDRNNEFYTIGKDSIDFSKFWRNLNIAINLMSPKLAKVFLNLYFQYNGLH